MTAKFKILIISFLTLTGLGVVAYLKHNPHASQNGITMKTRYTCPMHPQYTSDKPGDCPICNMRLVPIRGTTPLNQDRAREPHSTVAVEGRADIDVASDSEQLMGVRVSSVAWRSLDAVVRAAAQVAYDPDLYNAIREHQEAVRALKNTPRDSRFRSEAEDTVSASRLRLRQFGLSTDELERIGRPGFDPSNLLVGKQGSSVWVYIELYDDEASKVKPGQRVVLVSRAWANKTYQGVIHSVDTIVNNQTRTLRARAEIANPAGELKPDMYLDATLQIALGRKLSIPDTALLDTGTRQLVYVRTQPGHFTPRQISIGEQADGFVQVVQGLHAGDWVVSAANFFIDSESKLRAASEASTTSPDPMSEGMPSSTSKGTLRD